MQKGVVKFEDLSEGMMITGKIKNVVDFGAFVDLGIKETALVHISEMSDRFVKDPMEAVKVGDVLEFRIIGLDQDRRRISLSRKSGAAAASSGTAGSKTDGKTGGRTAVGAGRDSAGQSASKTGTAALSNSHTGGKKRVVAVKTGGHGGAERAGASETRGAERAFAGGERMRPAKDDDGTMYNPFAAAFKKMKDKDGKK
jgi:uncharacterized protein